MKYVRLFTFLTIMGSLVFGCADTTSHSRAVYMLMDTSGTYSRQLDQAKNIINYLLTHLKSGDSLAVARIDSASFSEKDIVAKATFKERPSMANQQKIHFKNQIDEFIAGVKGSSHTDIKGGILQAVEFLEETRAANKTILIFSDLEEDLPEGYVRDLSKIRPNLEGYRVVALNVTKLGHDQIDPEKYFKRLSKWEDIITELGGNWDKINDLERIDRVLARAQ